MIPATLWRCCPDRPDHGRPRRRRRTRHAAAAERRPRHRHLARPGAGHRRGDRVLVLGAVVYMAKKQRVKSYDGDDEFPEQICTTTPWRSAGPSSRRSSWSSAGSHCGAPPSTRPRQRLRGRGRGRPAGSRRSSWSARWWEFRYYFTEDVDADFLDDPATFRRPTSSPLGKWSSRPVKRSSCSSHPVT